MSGGFFSKSDAFPINKVENLNQNQKLECQTKCKF